MIESPYQLNKAQVRASFDRAAPQYDAVAVLQREVGQRLLERLDLVRLVPETILDVGCGTGAITAELMGHYRRARVYGLDLAPAMLAIARERSSWLRKLRCICADAEALPVADASIDLVFSNLALQWCEDLDQVFREFRRVLRPGGLVMFTTLGPDTLMELRRSWSEADGHTHVNAFMDMHDVGDALLRARLAEPVMDVERLTLTYDSLAELMRDLKTLGAHNLNAGRPRSLTGKGRLRAAAAAYERFRQDGRLPASYEVVYGHAWAPRQDESTVRRDHGVAVFPLSRLKGRGD